MSIVADYQIAAAAGVHHNLAAAEEVHRISNLSDSGFDQDNSTCSAAVDLAAEVVEVDLVVAAHIVAYTPLPSNPAPRRLSHRGRSRGSAGLASLGSL